MLAQNPPNKKQESYKKNCAQKRVDNISIMLSLVTRDTLGSDVVRGQLLSLD